MQFPKLPKPNKKIIAMITIILIIIIIIIGFIIRGRKIKPIYDLIADSNEPGIVEISWQDDEIPDDENISYPIYTVYWSDRPHIFPELPETYKHYKVVGATRTFIDVRYAYVYIKVGKKNYLSEEIMVPVLSDTQFTLENLDMKILKRGEMMGLEMNVLENADTYRFYYELSDGEVLQQDFDVKGQNRVNLKIKNFEDTIVRMSYIKDLKESEAKILQITEIFSPRR